MCNFDDSVNSASEMDFNPVSAPTEALTPWQKYCAIVDYIDNERREQLSALGFQLFIRSFSEESAFDDMNIEIAYKSDSATRLYFDSYELFCAIRRTLGYYEESEYGSREAYFYYIIAEPEIVFN